MEQKSVAWTRLKTSVVIGTCIVFIAGILGFLLWLGPREPAFQGKTLTAWLYQYYQSLEGEAHLKYPLNREDGRLRDEARDAVKHIGAEAIPALLEMAAVHDSRIKREALALVRKQPLIQVRAHTERDYHRMAFYGFQALGAAARPAVPTLVALLKDPDDEIRETAVIALGEIGPAAGDAIPALLEHLSKDSSRFVRAYSARILGNIGKEEPDRVVPVLIEQLGLTNDSTLCVNSLDALRQFGPRANAAVPSIRPFLEYPNIVARQSATNALRAIDPEAAAKAGIPLRGRGRGVNP